MNIISILWQISFISMILAFGVEIGLSLGLSRFNKKYFISLYLTLFLGNLILTKILSLFSESLKTWIPQYITIIYLIMAIVMIVIALDIIIKMKRNKKAFKLHLLANIMIIICCIFLMTLNTIFIAPTIGMSVDLLSIYSTLLLLIISGITYLSTRILKRNQEEYPVILSNYMLMFGEYFIFSALFLPNISLALQKTSNVTINSYEHMFSLALVFIALIILGITINTKKNLLK